jgi:hypothetical protein
LGREALGRHDVFSKQMACQIFSKCFGRRPFDDRWRKNGFELHAHQAQTAVPDYLLGSMSLGAPGK